jgi:hypothetical protein
MKKKKLAKLTLSNVALVGLVNGLLINGHLVASLLPTSPKAAKEKVTPADQMQSKESEANSENLGYHILSEEELLLELNDEGTKKYNSLSPEGKTLAREVASQRCQYTNRCKGLNACQTDNNKCAGLASCKGKTKCAFSDKNLAVKLVSEKMEQKRSGSMKDK